VLAKKEKIIAVGGFHNNKRYSECRGLSFVVKTNY
jgi:hypothetical protein